MASATELTTCELSVVLPCLNEAETLATCITKARDSMARLGIDGEIVVADNGNDGSQAIAVEHGARAVPVPERGRERRCAPSPMPTAPS